MIINHRWLVLVHIGYGIAKSRCFPQDKSWLYTGDEEIDRKLIVGYESCILITLLPLFSIEGYAEFAEEVRHRLIEPPFYSNISASEVNNNYINHFMRSIH